MYSLSWSIASLAAPLLGGTVIDHYGADALWTGCAVIGTVAALGYGLLLRSLPGQAGQAGAGAVAGSPRPRRRIRPWLR